MQFGNKELQKLTLMDDIFANMVFGKDPSLVEEVLRILLGDPDLYIMDVQTQKEILNPHGKSVVFDVYAKGNRRRFFDLEFQNEISRFPKMRACANSSSMFLYNTKQGTAWEKQEFETYTIIFSRTDPFGEGSAVYDISKYTNRSSALLYDDRQYILYVNCAYKGDDPIGALIRDFLEPEASKICNQKIREKVAYLKSTKEGIRQMLDYFYEHYGTEIEHDKMVARQEGLAEGRAAGRAEGRVEGREEGKTEGIVEGRIAGHAEGTSQTWLNAIRSLMAKSSIDLGSAMDLLSVPEEEKDKIIKAFEN